MASKRSPTSDSHYAPLSHNDEAEQRGRRPIPNTPRNHRVTLADVSDSDNDEDVYSAPKPMNQSMVMPLIVTAIISAVFTAIAVLSFAPTLSAPAVTPVQPTFQRTVAQPIDLDKDALLQFGQSGKHVRFPYLALPVREERVLMYSVDNRPMAGAEWPQNRGGERDIPFWQFANLNHKMFSMRHGYDFLTQNGTMNISKEALQQQYGDNAQWIEVKRAVEWAKVWVLRRYLPYYDYIVYADSDAVFVDFELGVIEMMDKYFPGFTNTSKDLVAISTDQLSYGQGVNGGFYIVKGGRQTTETAELIEEWWRSIMHPRNETHLDSSQSFAVTNFCKKYWRNSEHGGFFEKLRFDWPREQGAFNTHIYCDPRWDDRILVLPEEIAFSRAHHKDSLYVEHLFASAIPRDEQQYRSHRAMLNSLLHLTRDENFDSPELRLAKEALDMKVFPDEIRLLNTTQK